jgi:hypothetical protein
MSADKIIPKPDDLNLELFQAIIAGGHLCVQKCGNCGNYAHPPRMFCARCFSGDYSYAQVSGAGTVYSYTLSHHTAEPAWQEELPYLTIVVQLDQGPRIVGAARIDEPATVRIGQRVRVVPEARTDDFAYLTVVFESAQDS